MHKPKPVYQLSAHHFLDMLKTGAMRVISKESYINQMNYFPVSDHDTGSNLAALMRFISSSSYPTAQFTPLLRQIADTSLIGACGNSGMILSAFFVGFASNQGLSTIDTITPNQFVDCVELGVNHAYQSVLEPVEGTILTVMSEWLKACKDALPTSKDFVSLFESSVRSAQEALKKTKLQLPVLKNRQVVDAGAFGFVELIQGMYSYLVNQKKVETVLPEAPLPTQHENHQFDEYPDYDYCFESLLRSGQANTDEIKLALQAYGNSLAINKAPEYVKVHIHTNELLAITQQLKKFGAIQYQKIDNMKKQWEVAHARKHSIALVTDSVADLSKEWLQEKQIHVIPAQVRIDADTYLDRMTISLESLYQDYHENNREVGTSPPSPEAISRYLNYLASHYDSIIVITASSRLSSMHQMIANAATKIKTVPIDVIDSLKISVGQGLLVMKAAQWIQEGRSHEWVVNQVKALRSQTRMFVALGEFKSIVKSGRAPKALGILAEWLQLKPIITMDENGKSSIAGIGIGKKMCMNKMLRLINKVKQQHSSYTLGIAHTAAFDKASAFATRVTEETQIKVDFIEEASCAIGLHVGKGCIGVGIMGEAIRSPLAK